MTFSKRRIRCKPVSVDYSSSVQQRRGSSRTWSIVDFDFSSLCRFFFFPFLKMFCNPLVLRASACQSSLHSPSPLVASVVRQLPHSRGSGRGRGMDVEKDRFGADDFTRGMNESFIELCTGGISWFFLWHNTVGRKRKGNFHIWNGGKRKYLKMNWIWTLLLPSKYWLW